MHLQTRKALCGDNNTTTHCFLNTVLAKPEKQEAGGTWASTGKARQGEVKFGRAGSGLCFLD